MRYTPFCMGNSLPFPYMRFYGSGSMMIKFVTNSSYNSLCDIRAMHSRSRIRVRYGSHQHIITGFIEYPSAKDYLQHALVNKGNSYPFPYMRA
ncbi:hypothetical protein SAMN05428949_0981 [Chitinophaga sp. YR627]|nr:hypothetical protein SAMN05428949_0981 [Chitinophaga sp. YR627]